VVIENTYGSVLSGNMIEECQDAAVVLDRSCYGITISANVIAHNFGGGVDLRGAWGCTLSANTFVLNPVLSIRAGPGTGRITITGNNFSDSFIGGKTRRRVKDNAAAGIILIGADDIAISGNTFSGLNTLAVAADERCRRLVIIGNVIIHSAGGRSDDHPIKCADKQAVIEHNSVANQTALEPSNAPTSAE